MIVERDTLAIILLRLSALPMNCHANPLFPRYLLFVDPMMNNCKLNGWLFNNGHMTGQMANHMGDHVTSDSVVEHFTSVSMQEGYDNLMFNTMIKECHGS